MIKEAFRDDKNFIVARLKSRASDKFDNKIYPESRVSDHIKESRTLLAKEGKVLSNHFNIYSIIKILFKKRGDEFVGRFDPDYTLASLNPLTNNRIIGEVEFFFVENPFLKIFPSESRYPVG